MRSQINEALGHTPPHPWESKLPSEFSLQQQQPNDGTKFSQCWWWLRSKCHTNLSHLTPFLHFHVPDLSSGCSWAQLSPPDPAAATEHQLSSSL